MPEKFDQAAIKRFVSGRRVGVLATVGKDGAPVLTPIWYAYTDGVFLMRTGGASAKARNVRRDPRASICVQDEQAPYASVTAYGRASIEQERPGLAEHIAKRYLGAMAARVYLRTARGDIEASEEVTLVLRPDRFVSQDFSADTPVAGKIWLKLKRFLPARL